MVLVRWLVLLVLVVPGACKAGSVETPPAEEAGVATAPAAASEAPAGDFARAVDGTRPRVRAAHILVSYKGAPRMPFPVHRNKQEAETRAQAILKRALAGEDFEKLAVAESDDKTVNSNRGSLGYFEPSKLPAPISQAAYALNKGQVAPELVETGFGFHILKRTD